MNYKFKNEGVGKYIFLGITALVCFLTASSVLPFLSLPEVGLPVPDIMLCFVCSLPAFTDLKKASIYVLALGFFADLFINSPTAFSPLVFLCCMLIAHFCQKYFARVGTLAIAISTIPCSFLKCLFSLAVTAVTVGAEAAKNEFLAKIPMMLIADFAAAIVLCFVMRVLCKKMKFKINN